MIKWEQIDAHLDWTAIKAACRGGIPPVESPTMFAAPDESAQALRMVERGLRRWAARDLYTAEIDGTESHFNFRGLAHGFIDLELRIVREYKSFTRDHVGKKAIVDWKSTKGALDAAWVTRLEHSWQWKLYAAAQGAEIMIYRGIAKSEGEREVILDLPPVEDLEEIVEHQFRGYHEVLRLHDSRTNIRHPAWNRHMPYACGAYAHKCPHVEDCTKHTSPFVIIPPEILAKPISYSSGERLALCPERHRRYLIAREGLDTTLGEVDDLDETEETRLGSAMHRGLEEAYKQMKTLRESGKL